MFFACKNQPAYKNPDLSVEKRVNDLISRMTLDEKISQMMNSAAPVERLGIPAYNWWSEGLHGVAVSGNATVFPQAIGLGATWDSALIHKMADIISTEFRGKYNDYIKKDDHALFHGLTPGAQTFGLTVADSVTPKDCAPPKVPNSGEFRLASLRSVARSITTWHPC